MNREILAVYIVFTLHITGYFVQQFNLAFIAKDQNMSDATFGLLQSLFWALQIVGSPIFAILTSKFGLKTSIHVCNIMTIILYMVLIGINVSSFKNYNKAIIYI